MRHATTLAREGTTARRASTPIGVTLTRVELMPTAAQGMMPRVTLLRTLLAACLIAAIAVSIASAGGGRRPRRAPSATRRSCPAAPRAPSPPPRSGPPSA